MAENRESAQQVNKARDFKIEGPEVDINIHQKGRVSKLTHPATGQRAYFIDVTDRVDPTRAPLLSDSPGVLVSEAYREELSNPKFNDKYGMWKDLSVLITDKLDEQGRRRIYLGFPVTDITDKTANVKKELTEPILREAGFERIDNGIPFSGYINHHPIERTREIVFREIEAATAEVPIEEQEALQQAGRVLAPA